MTWHPLSCFLGNGDKGLGGTGPGGDHSADMGAAGQTWDGKEALCWRSCGTSVIPEVEMWLSESRGEFQGHTRHYF